ncbi:hypothetical protein EXQ25_01145 [Clostridium botulinum]|nr:hypothetical protein [Clostridium botulinum]MBO0534026.1 hypothetical protein [Clostridium botulinum]
MGGGSCNFFAFNTITKELEKMISIPNSEGIISMVSDGDFVYFGTYNSATLYRYNIKTETLDKLTDVKMITIFGISKLMEIGFTFQLLLEVVFISII